MPIILSFIIMNSKYCFDLEFRYVCPVPSPARAL